jgi:mannose-6-phosphate isomerase-like protein (cupin superfamily)
VTAAADGGRSREIANSATGETVRFVRTAAETGGELLVMEARWSNPQHATPPHLHPTMEERWHVLEGKVAYLIGGEETVAGPGDQVTAPAGVMHSNRNVGGAPALIRIEMRPALRWEEFIRQLFALASEGFEGTEAQRSITELVTEFSAEIEVSA